MILSLTSTVYHKCCQTLDTLRGFISVHLLSQRAYERFESFTRLFSTTLSSIVRVFSQTSTDLVVVLIDERGNRGSFYSLYGSDPRRH